VDVRRPSAYCHDVSIAVHSPLIKKATAAELLDVSTRTIARLILDGALVAFKVRGQVRVSRLSIDAYLAKNQIAAR
jgi:excisionase family DNA binding protein